MIDSNDIFLKKTKEAVSAIDNSFGAVNVLSVCDEYYDLWHLELIPKLRRHKIAVYPFLVNFFHEAGCMNVTEKMLQSYFCKIKKRKGGSQDSRVPLNQVQPSLHIPTAVDIPALPGVMPIVPSQVAPAVVKTPVKPVSDDQQEYPHVYAKVSLTPPMDYEDFGADLKSLQEQSRSGWLDWSGTDEGYWLGFLSVIEKYNKTYDPKWAVKANQVNFWKYIEREDDIAMFKVLLKKAVEKRKI